MAKTTIIETFRTGDDEPERGYVTFALATAAQHDDDAIVTRSPVKVLLDSEGAMSVDLQPTSGADADWSVENLSYRVQEVMLDSRGNPRPKRTYYIDVPTSATDVRLGDLATYATAPAMYVPVPGPPGEQGDPGPQGPAGEVTEAELTAALAAAAATANATYVLRSRAWVNVKDYGAVGDGVTEESAAIQAAVNALPASGGTVYFPPGTYYLLTYTGGNQAVLIPNNSSVVLLGAGRGVSILKSEATTAGSGTMIGQAGSGSIHAEKLSFQGPTGFTGTVGSTTCLSINTSAGASSVSNLTVRDCDFLGFSYQVRSQGGASSQLRITVDGCTLDGNAQNTTKAATPILIGGVGELSVADSIIKNYGHGFLVTAVDTSANDVTVASTAQFTEAGTISFHGGTLPSPLNRYTYKANIVSATKIRPYTTTPGDVDLTTSGSGYFYVGTNQAHGIYADLRCSLFIDRVRFSGQVGHGFAIQHYGGTGTAPAFIRDCYFAADTRHAIYGGEGLLRVSGCDFLNTSATDLGVALSIGDTLIASDNLFSGIALTFRSGEVAMFNNCRFLDPGASFQSITRLAASTLHLRDCVFSDTYANSISGPTTGTAYYDGVTFSDIPRLSSGNEILYGTADSTGVIRAKGTGSPEGVLTAGVGSTYHRTDGGAGTCLYVKESGTGNTGWVAK